MLSIPLDSAARLPIVLTLWRTAQFDDQFPHIDRQRAGKGEPFGADRMDEAEPGGVERLTGEADPGESSANRGERASIDRISH